MSAGLAALLTLALFLAWSFLAFRTGRTVGAGCPPEPEPDGRAELRRLAGWLAAVLVWLVVMLATAEQRVFGVSVLLLTGGVSMIAYTALLVDLGRRG